ncbi:SRPBCC family protein [Spongiimicrobium sp. 2-473A-2-J]|uniref:SRPBCC family protein n=1 Tax=Eudoraea algarum TaxID=3417568 RepID=UPI003D363D2C
MVDVLTDIQIFCPRHRVAEYVANPDNAHEWYVNIKSAVWLTPKPAEIGTRIAFKANFLGRQLMYTYEIVEFVPMKRLVMQSVDGPFPMETSYTWEDFNGGHTHMTLRNRGNPTGFSKFVAPFMAAAMKRANGIDLKRLKKVLENKNHAS